ncbi:hypothetical protein KPH14_011582 [Odynerus spinipes]|uniref:Uncharacterized protein n=1 Tax=Odynerus spinipes TaxID=1348599 RepID=A0AAD9RHC8_9HYME|nr:hypothetical protein KPH14_011582 [Odynerus spinipes]
MTYTVCHWRKQKLTNIPKETDYGNLADLVSSSIRIESRSGDSTASVCLTYHRFDHASANMKKIVHHFEDRLGLKSPFITQLVGQHVEGRAIVGLCTVLHSSASFNKFVGSLKIHEHLPLFYILFTDTYGLLFPLVRLLVALW